MNKIKLGLTVLVLVLLVGCSGDKEKSTSCKLDASQVKMNYIFKSKNDKILNLNLKQIVDTTNVNMSKEEIASLVDSYKEKYNINGVSYEPKIEEDKVTEVIKVDVEKANIEELMQVGIINNADENGKVNYLSLKKSLKGLKEKGASCND